MALQKSKTLANGSSGNYWRLTLISFDRQNLQAYGHIALFKDKATSDSGAPPLGCEKSFSFPLVVADLISAGNPITFIYGLIVAKANTLISMDLSGHVISPPVYTDPDLAGATMV